MLAKDLQSEEMLWVEVCNGLKEQVVMPPSKGMVYQM